MPARILVADDDPVSVQTLSSILKAAGFDVVVAQDAMQAIMRAVRDAPDAVVLDIGMPGGGGEKVLERLKASSKTSAIPVVVVSGVPNASGRAPGVAAVMAKPVKPEQLVDALKNALKSSQP